MDIETHLAVMGEIEKIAEESLRKLYDREDRGEVVGANAAINWADLHCTDVELVLSLSEYQYDQRCKAEGRENPHTFGPLYRVTVEECSELNNGLATYVAGYVKERLGVIVEVRCEW